MKPKEIAKTTPILRYVAKNFIPVEGLKHFTLRGLNVLTEVAKNFIPVEGLKQKGIRPASVWPGRVAKNFIPVEGLKREGR